MEGDRYEAQGPGSSRDQRGVCGTTAAVGERRKRPGI